MLHEEEKNNGGLGNTHASEVVPSFNKRFHGDGLDVAAEAVSSEHEYGTDAKAGILRIDCLEAAACALQLHAHVHIQGHVLLQLQR